MRMQFILGAAALALGACAPFPHTEAPLATNFDTTKQLKLQAAHHWQVIANSTADALAQSIAKGNVCIPGASCPRLHVAQTTPRSQFGRAFREQFISRLVSSGQNVTANATDAEIIVNIEGQAVRFSPSRRQYLGVGKFTMMAAGLWGFHEINEHQVADSPGGVVTAAAIIADVLEYNMSEFAKGPTPRTELVLTASAQRKGQFVARSTSVFYIADGDASLYCWRDGGCGDEVPTPVIPVVGDCGSAPCRSTPMGGYK